VVESYTCGVILHQQVACQDDKISAGVAFAMGRVSVQCRIIFIMLPVRAVIRDMAHVTCDSVLSFMDTNSCEC